jgi:death on curing protein
LFYLTVSAIKKIHNYIIESQGGVADGVRPLNEGNIQGASERPKTKIRQKPPDRPMEPFSDLIAKTTALGYALNKFHGFTDGNKRTSLMCMVLMLYVNGADMVIPTSMTKYLLLVAQDRMSEEDFEKVIRRFSSSSVWIIRLKHLRYWTLPETVYSVLFNLPFTRRWAEKIDLDWIGAGEEQSLKRYNQEYDMWERQGYPKNDVELKLADNIEDLKRYGDITEE